MVGQDGRDEPPTNNDSSGAHDDCREKPTGNQMG